MVALLAALPAGPGTGAPGSLAAQSASTLWLRGPSGERHAVSVASHRGYAALPAGALARAGWRAVRSGADLVRLEQGVTGGGTGGTAARLEFRPGSPFFRWSGRVLQLADDPYLMGDELYLPLQFVAEVLPRELGELYAWDASSRVLSVTSPELWEAGAALAAATDGVGGPGGEASAPAGGAGADPEPVRVPERPSDPTRVVVIDPGHGGRDPGAVGSGGVREKDVALALGLALARELRRVPNLEVHVTREDDVLVPLWQRGERATRWKGERPGIFVSLHANALPTNRSIRGFETYFLAEARTDHARRVAAIENAPLGVPGGDEERGAPAEDPDLSFILRDLGNLDHQHWSALLAEMIHEELDPVHPGPNRGVKQGPFAVITNALMPAVLVEIGFLTHRQEEQLLERSAFREDAAVALARAIVGFFERYPPEQGLPVGSRP